jgi:hypothetical protein
MWLLIRQRLLGCIGMSPRFRYICCSAWPTSHVHLPSIPVPAIAINSIYLLRLSELKQSVNAMTSSYSTLDPAAVELSDQITHRNGLGAEGDCVSLLEHNQSGLKVQNAEINIAKDCNQTPTQFAWKTPLAIVGCYVSGNVRHLCIILSLILTPLLATILAVFHYIFFRLIDGQEASHMFALRQSQVTTVSFLLVTAFRASIVAALGTSFTQYLWYVLRIRCLQVELIESLFKIRSNAWGLFNYKIMRHAPLLFAAAALSWTIPLATIYPPGALTIRFESHTFTTGLNASIMNPPPVSADSSQLPTLAEVFHGVHYHWLGEDIGQRGYVGSTYELVDSSLSDRGH